LINHRSKIVKYYFTFDKHRCFLVVFY